uniref:Reverse transcriptase domain-containing protein n=1 Tax=Tanacetum cinerariifolium TaxID=118510 RepID=A0A6L2J0Y1_TANCI|nr:reverse transcriptase domain-containing protein [Tanacetum cinerariifolium]
MVSKFLSKYYPYLKALQLRKDILNFQQLPTESVFEAWERYKSCLRKCPDHRIILVDQILTFYHGITMIDQEKVMVATGGNIMRKTPQEAYDLIENMTQHYFLIEVIRKQIAWISQNLQHQPRPGHPNIVYYPYSDESDEDEPSEIDKSEIDPLIRESTDTFIMMYEEIELNSHDDIDDLVLIPRVGLGMVKIEDDDLCLLETPDLHVSRS